MPDTYLKLHDGLPEHRKIVAVGGDAGWLHVCALAYASRNLSDGHIPIGLVSRLSDRKNPAKLAAKLIEVGLWHASGHDCERCPQPAPDQYLIHDYLIHQRSAAKVEEIKEKRAVAGRKGGTRKAANGKAGASPPGKQPSSKLLEGWQEGAEAKGTPDTEAEEVLRTSLPEADLVPPSAGAAALRATAPAAAAEELTLTQRSKRITDAYARAEPMCKWPAVNGIVLKALQANRWTDDEIHDAVQRLAVDNRGVTVETLRRELAPPAPSRSPSSSPGGTQSTTDQRVAAAFALARQLAGEHPTNEHHPKEITR